MSLLLLFFFLLQLLFAIFICRTHTNWTASVRSMIIIMCHSVQSPFSFGYFLVCSHKTFECKQQMKRINQQVRRNTEQNRRKKKTTKFTHKRHTHTNVVQASACATYALRIHTKSQAKMYKWREKQKMWTGFVMWSVEFSLKICWFYWMRKFLFFFVDFLCGSKNIFFETGTWCHIRKSDSVSQRKNRVNLVWTLYVSIDCSRLYCMLHKIWVTDLIQLQINTFQCIWLIVFSLFFGRMSFVIVLYW